MDEIGNLLSSEESFDEDKVTELVAAFYRRVRVDDVIGPLYPANDWEGAEKRLRDFLIFRFGGSDRYIQERGHPRLRMRHIPFAIGVSERDRWLEIMNEAIDEVGVPNNRLLEVKTFFQQVANFLQNQ